MAVRGEGSIYQDKSSGLWVAAIPMPDDGSGRRRRKKIHGKTKSDVIKKRRDFLRDLEDGIDVASPSITVGAWLDHWHSDICKDRVSPRVWRSYASTITKHIKPAIGRRRLDQLTAQHVRDMHRTIAAKGLGRTVEVSHNVLSRALKDAKNERRIRYNVCEQMDRPKAPSKARGAMSVAQAKAVLATAIQNDDPFASRWAAAILLGVRQGELLGLTWDRVNFRNHTIDLSWQKQDLPWRHGCGAEMRGGGWPCKADIPEKCHKREADAPAGYEHRQIVNSSHWVRPKTSTSLRVVPMPPLLEALLLRHAETSAWLGSNHNLVWCREDSRPIRSLADREAWYAALARAGVPKMDLHCARHTTATLLLELGVPMEVIAQILGHSSVLSTKTYAHVDVTLAAEALGRLGSAIDPKLIEAEVIDAEVVEELAALPAPAGGDMMERLSAVLGGDDLAADVLQWMAEKDRKAA